LRAEQQRVRGSDDVWNREAADETDLVRFCRLAGGCAGDKGARWRSSIVRGSSETPIRADKSSIAYRRWLRSRGITYGTIPANA
jgi:hypothetical protein